MAVLLVNHWEQLQVVDWAYLWADEMVDKMVDQMVVSMDHPVVDK